jgi:hypothetical protein
LKTLLVLSAHVFLDAAFGWSLLNATSHRRSAVETLLAGVLLGMYVETLSVAILMFMGVPLAAAGIAIALLMAGVIVAAVYFPSLKRRGGCEDEVRADGVVSPAETLGRTDHPGASRHPSFSRSGNRPQLQWYEWALLATVGEKILFGAWQLARTHTYFVDALMHWSGRARSLFGEVNWSWDPASPFFLGQHIGNANYPLLTILWRALSAKWNGNWNEIISRADGLIFFIVIVGTVWAAVLRFSNRRDFAAAAAFVVSAVPLHAWHAAAGYNDIAVEAFVVVALATLLRREWFIAGLIMAGAAWSKNDALVLYFPALLLAAALLQLGHERKWRNVGVFLLGFATILPWLAFNYAHSLGITPGKQQIGWHSDAPELLWNAFMSSPTSSILWICIVPWALYSCVALFRDQAGRALIAAFLTALSTIVFLFTSTSAYTFLANETTIHRVLMQFSPVAILTAAYGVWLKKESEEKKTIINDRRPSPGAARRPPAKAEVRGRRR